MNIRFKQIEKSDKLLSGKQELENQKSCGKIKWQDIEFEHTNHFWELFDWRSASGFDTIKISLENKLVTNKVEWLKLCKRINKMRNNY